MCGILFLMTTPEKMLPSSQFDHLADYEAWVSKYWVHSPGSTEAQRHARAKFDKETHELITALTSGTPEEIISEAGDALWTATATASNAGITLTEVLSSAFPGYFKANAPIHTQDVDSIAATLFDDISTKDVQGYLQENRIILAKTIINREDRAHIVAMTTLLVSFIAQRYAGESLAAVLEANYQKIEARVRRGDSVTRLPRSYDD
jgi:phosphoribosyl-ATP pyrophosphohydrolase